MKRIGVFVLSLLSALTVMAAGGAMAAEKPTMSPSCGLCHTSAPDVVRGNMTGYSEQFKTMNVSIGKLTWVIKYDDKTVIAGAPAIKDIEKGKEVAVTFAKADGKDYATKVSVKQPFVLPKEKLVSVEEMMKLAESGPEKGKFTLIDARPKAAYLDAHLPGALSLPLADFDKAKDTVLPAEKDNLVIFYCAGPT